MKKAVKSSIGWSCVLVTLLFWPIAILLPENDFETAILDAVGFSVAMGVLVSFFPTIWEAVRLPQDQLQRGHYLVLGVFGICCSAAIRFGWLWLWRIMDHPQWMLHSHVLGWGLWLFIVGGAFHLVADQAGPNGQPPRKWVIIGTIATLGLSTVGITITIMFKDLWP